MKKLLAMPLALIMVLSMAACGAKAPAEEAPEADAPEAEAPVEEAVELDIVSIPKLVGVAWFDRMDGGGQEWVSANGGTFYQNGPSTADAALQLQTLQDAITEGANVIHVVPNSTETLEVAMAEARDAGIIVLSHEAPGAENVDYDVEAFENDAYGEHFMKILAEQMGEEGEYAIIVGSVQAQTHVAWADAAVAYQEANYPNMKLACDYIESGEDHDTAYNKTKEALKTYPNLKGIIGCSVIDPAGAALAVEEAGLVGEVTVIGTSVSDVVGSYLESGAVYMFSSWDTSATSYAMCEASKILAEGGEITTGTNLGAEGYESVTVDGKVIYGAAWLDFTVDNYKDDPYRTAE